MRNVRVRTRSHGARFLTTVVLATVLVSAMPIDAIGIPRVLVPRKGAYLGAWVGGRSGETGREPIRRVERQIGRRFAIDHRFHRWNTSLPTSYDRQTMRDGRLPFVDWSAVRRDGSIARWEDIADGRYDGWIRQQADRIESWGRPMYLSFHHEPENDGAIGTPAEYAAAFRRIVRIFRARGARNVAFVWTMMSWSFDRDSGRDIGAWYPGDRFVHIIGTNGYNWYPRRAGARWETFARIIQPTVRWAARRDKPVFVVEWGAMEDPDRQGRKGRWFRNVLPYVKRWPRIKALIYFDEVKDGYPWVTDSSSSSMSGYRALAGADYLARMAR